MKRLPKISEAEYEVMKIIWEFTPIGTNEVIEKLQRVSDWTPQTIQTMLSRLVKKGVIDYYKSSRMFIYTPVILEQEYVELEKDTFLGKYYDGKINTMLVNFLDSKQLSKDELLELRKLLDERIGDQNE